ncbi:Elongation of very long chain fatty acids protein AAEL008004 [Gryllus bimaculatus]|nr:Elongation of very long chain fatty acids protein AAEL008004 [Gryllus bimaculatus]
MNLILFEGSKIYFINKVFDLLDTIFFVLRGVGCCTGIANGVVHIVMYTYYLLSIQGYNVWWKKYLTQLQLVQFIIILIHAFGGVFYERCTKYNFLITSSIIINALFFVYLFGSFYLKTYLGEKKKKNL